MAAAALSGARRVKKVQPRHREFDAWAWNKHVTSQAHKKAVCEPERERMSMANWGMCA